jgi:hypothetical protein
MRMAVGNNKRPFVCFIHGPREVNCKQETLGKEHYSIPISPIASFNVISIYFDA